MPTSDQFSPEISYKSKEDFEPVQEIRRLRRDLADRIELLRLRNSEVSQNRSKVSDPFDLLSTQHSIKSYVIANNEDIDSSKFADVPNDIASNQTIQNHSFDLDRSADKNIKRIEERLDHVDQALMQLQEPIVQETVISKKTFEHKELQQKSNETPPVKQPQSMETIIEIQTIPATVSTAFTLEPAESTEFESNIDRKESILLTILTKANMGLVLIGAFSVLLAILYFLRGGNGDTQFGTPIVFVGLSLIIVGVVGRFVHYYANRHEIQRGKLTTAP